MVLEAAIEKLCEANSLSASETEEVFSRVFHHEVPEGDVRKFLALLYQKGETADEILGAVRFLRKNAAVKLPEFRDAVDCCGTGGDRHGTINVSTAVAFVLAGGGVRVAKHGNRAVSSLSGSADVLKELGVNIEMSPAATVRCLERVGITFLWAPQYYPILRKVAEVRKSLPHRTIFNLIGPLLNPMGARRHLLGVFDATFVPVLANCLQALGSEAAVVASSADGLDEFSLSAAARVAQFAKGKLREFDFDPWAATGYPRCGLEALKGGTPAENALRLKQCLKGHSEPADHVVHINAAWGFVAAGRTATFMDGLLLAQDSVSSGRAYRKLEELADLSHAA